MSLVDYASSSEDEEVGEDKEPQHSNGKEERWTGKQEQDESAVVVTASSRFSIIQPERASLPATHRHPDIVASSRTLHMEKLPDASVLLSSSSFLPHQYIGTDNYSRIAAPTPKKRESNGSTFIQPRNKHPRGNLAHSRNIPDTVSGSLVPPQLKGRSNVVTEDIGKLFLHRHKESSSG